MILRNQLGPQDAQLLNHDFQEYLTRFGELQKIAGGILDKLANGQRKTFRRRYPPMGISLRYRRGKHPTRAESSRWLCLTGTAEK